MSMQYRICGSLGIVAEDDNTVPLGEKILFQKTVVPPSLRSQSTIRIAIRISYQLDAIEYLFVFFQLDMFRAYTPIFRSNGC